MGCVRVCGGGASSFAVGLVAAVVVWDAWRRSDDLTDSYLVLVAL